MLQHEIQVRSQDKQENTVQPQLTCEKLSTKFFSYKVGQNPASFEQVSEQEVFIAQQVHSSVNDDQQEADKKNLSKSNPLQQLSYFADTWSILRFIKGTKSQGVQISPDGKLIKMARVQSNIFVQILGLTLSITSHSHKGQAQEDELVLTNMAFTSGLHFWEVLATISCSNLCKSL